MTDHHVDEEASQSGQNGRPKWLWRPASFVVFCLAFVSVYPIAAEYGFVLLFKIICGVLIVFYGIFFLIFLFRFVRALLRNWTGNKAKLRDYEQLVKKVRDHVQLVDELAKWKNAAGKATARAADLEARLATWDRSNLEEGRRRLAGELAARGTKTSFGPIEWAEEDETLVCGAEWSGEIPTPRARYLLRSKTIKGTKAVLKVQAIKEDKTVLFSVESIVSEKYRANLVDSAQSGKPFVGDVEIVSREDDLEMEKEALWPEN